MTSLQQEPSAHAPYTRTMFGRASTSVLGWLSEDDFVNHFTADIDPVRARAMDAVQQLGHMQLVQGFAPQMLNRG